VHTCQDAPAPTHSTPAALPPAQLGRRWPPRWPLQQGQQYIQRYTHKEWLRKWVYARLQCTLAHTQKGQLVRPPAGYSCTAAGKGHVSCLRRSAAADAWTVHTSTSTY
jgi:hypothetical protein